MAEIVPFDTDPQKRLRIVHCAGCEAYEAQTRAMAEQREADELEMRRMRRRIKHMENEKSRALREHEDFVVADAVFQFWKKIAGKNVRTGFADERIKAVISALAYLRKNYNDDDDHAPRALCCAIIGCVRNGFVGENGKRNDELELICRNSIKIEMNLDRYREYMASKGEEPLV